MKKRIVALAVVCAVSLACVLAVADDFGWMPRGGCELLLTAAAIDNGANILKALKKKKTIEEWKEYFELDAGISGALNGREREILAAYLSINFPAENINLSANAEELACADLPPDGKKLTLEKCSLCHPIAPIMTDERSVEGWRGVYDLSPMPQSGLSEPEIETLIHYLAYSTPVPAENIPIEMKMPLPGY